MSFPSLFLFSSSFIPSHSNILFSSSSLILFTHPFSDFLPSSFRFCSCLTSSAWNYSPFLSLSALLFASLLFFHLFFCFLHFSFCSSFTSFSASFPPFFLFTHPSPNHLFLLTYPSLFVYLYFSFSASASPPPHGITPPFFISDQSCSPSSHVIALPFHATDDSYCFPLEILRKHLIYGCMSKNKSYLCTRTRSIFLANNKSQV